MSVHGCAAAGCRVCLFLEEHSQLTTGPVWFSPTHARLGHPVTLEQYAQQERKEGGNITRLTRIHKPSTKKSSVNLRAPSRRLSTARKYNTLTLLLESDEIFTLSFTGNLNFFFSYPFLSTTCVANCLIWCCSFTCTCLWFLRWMELQWKGFNSTDMILLGFRIICFPSVIRRLTLSLLTDWLSFIRYEACITADHRRVTTIFLWL